ncbi:MAG TPA: hypothetical protein VFP47_18460 [Pyrinomonadaceae bacterium]|nr:hypothetical protein [Pyrinomonadaceae bacterium]
MTLRRIVNTILFATVISVAVTARPVLAQTSGSTSQTGIEEDVNLDTQLYLLIATNQQVDDAKLPTTLTRVIEQLRGSLPFKNYRLAATLINRVKNNGRLSLQWLGGPLLPLPASSSNTPSFNEFKVDSVKLTGEETGKSVVRMDGFRFGARIPVQMESVMAASGSSAPVFQYQNTGLNTDISVREGEPVVVGTLNVGPSGDAIILVMSARRSSR